MDMKYKRTHTLLCGADKIADPTHTPVILALRLIQLKTDPLPTSELSGATETQCASLQEKGNSFYIFSKDFSI